MWIPRIFSDLPPCGSLSGSLLSAAPAPPHLSSQDSPYPSVGFPGEPGKKGASQATEGGSALAPAGRGLPSGPSLRIRLALDLHYQPLLSTDIQRSPLSFTDANSADAAPKPVAEETLASPSLSISKSLEMLLLLHPLILPAIAGVFLHQVFATWPLLQGKREPRDVLWLATAKVCVVEEGCSQHGAVDN
ncbi:hypothetical protein P7K49_030107 [Saguinus oedipus]|uniref:Uncharacterized protein n=1 Tax=Saguinus oedipus TaxID=9490 RepID=A0ABQ9U181_SAGOE|nr:hypothetical protein P7K49_030107 [Saguinus oedipus]